METCSDLGCPPIPAYVRWSHCSTCHASFTTDAAFDQHRTGPMDDRRCRTPEELAERGHSQDSRGRWRGRDKRGRTRDWAALRAGL